MKNLKHCLLVATFISFSPLALSEYRIYSTSQIIDFPEPTILCGDTKKGEASPETYYERHRESRSYSWGSYGLSEHVVYYKGSRIHFYSEWQCGACSGSYPDILTYNDKDYQFVRGEEIYSNSYEDDGNDYSGTTYYDNYEFCLNPIN
jgi:hypothetical protein